MNVTPVTLPTKGASYRPYAARAASTNKGKTNMSNIEINSQLLSDADLDDIAGGLNPQPLPPGPPPPDRFLRSSFATHFNFGRFIFER
jgi:penicillin V acylase-like amidase (Ntn superfamily)